MTEIVPWREVSPAIDGDVEDTIRGLHEWRGAARRAIISVEPYALSQLREVAIGAPWMRIIGGIKTSPLLREPGLDSRSAWDELSAAIDVVLSYTDEPFVLLEHESAVQPYVTGRRAIPGSEAIAAAVRSPWNRMTLLWYPSAAEGDNTLARYLALVESVSKALPFVRFIDHGRIWGPGEPSDPGARGRSQILLAKCNRRPIDMFYCHYVNGRPAAWPNDAILRAAELSPGPFVICYPGRNNWIAAGVAASHGRRAPAPRRLPKPAPGVKAKES